MVVSHEYAAIQSLPDVWAIAAKHFPDIVALNDPHNKPTVAWTYQSLYQQLQAFAAGLQHLGVTPDHCIAIFADNSPRWFLADQGSMLAGAVNAVRSALAERQELLYILQDSGSRALIVENQQTLKKLAIAPEEFPLNFIILLSDEDPNPENPIKQLNVKQLLELGENSALNPVHKTEADLATLIYTSGTTGKPKGVMLSHGNLLHQVRNLDAVITPHPNDQVLSILPSWHSFERSAEYFLLSRGCTLTYTSIRHFKTDLKHIKPHHMVGVPRLWESLYEGIQKTFREQSANQQKLINFFFGISQKYILAKRIADNRSLNHLHAAGAERFFAKVQALALSPLHLLGDKLIYHKVRSAAGGRFQTLISGGGSLARHLDDFYEIVNIPVLVGYGLTETSPVSNARTHRHNLRYSSGQPIPDTEIRIVDPETRQPVPPETQGLVLIRGPQVMQGYYNKPEATAKVLDAEGWFDSGDLGWVTPQNDLIITGRAKDTIVLSNGENIEPQPIEDACLRSAYIDQIMLVGQDQKSLGALIVPNFDALEQWGSVQGVTLTLPELGTALTELLESDLYRPEVVSLFRSELQREVKNRPGYRADDQVKDFRFLAEPFSQENGTMTQTLKVKRPVVTAMYQGLIAEMFT
ncbi:MAG: long-chain fatty acid--CoA ligase [Synechocystis sp.]|nr:long-chain fatty acid--CoA ligase [Synechocystis sp.]